MPYTIPPNILKKLYSLQIRVVKFADTTGQISRYMWSNSPKYSICSETSYYDNEYKSDISFSINDVSILTWTCPGDFGGRKGIYTPSFWTVDSTQYGMLKTLKVDEHGIYLDGIFQSNSITIKDLNLNKGNLVRFKVFNDENAKFKGGFNIFSKDFGDYNQDIEMDVEYE